MPLPGERPRKGPLCAQRQRLFPFRKVLYAVLASVLSQFAFCTVSMARKLHALSCLPEWNPETVLKRFYVLYSFCRPRGAKPIEGFNK